jgi:hypothetical protein
MYFHSLVFCTLTLVGFYPHLVNMLHEHLSNLFFYKINLMQVAQVLRTGVGRDVEFQQFTVGRYSLTIHIETERARRAAEAAAAELAWPFEEPWEDWEDEEAAAEPWEDWEDEEAAADEDNFD